MTPSPPSPEVKERPILFSAPMVQALLAGRKAQTRRIVKPRGRVSLFAVEGDGSPQWVDNYVLDPGNADWRMRDNPYGKPGDRLWVRETWQVARETLDYETGAEYDVFSWDADIYGAPEDYLNGDARGGTSARVFYAADGEDVNPSALYDTIGLRGQVRSKREMCWHPSIFMPRWASRLTLEVTDVRAERLQDISEADAIAEGVERDSDGWRDYEMPSTQCASSAGDSYRTLWDSINGSGSWEANPWVWAVSFKVLPHPKEQP